MLLSLPRQPWGLLTVPLRHIYLISLGIFTTPLFSTTNAGEVCSAEHSGAGQTCSAVVGNMHMSTDTSHRHRSRLIGHRLIYFCDWWWNYDGPSDGDDGERSRPEWRERERESGWFVWMAGGCHDDRNEPQREGDRERVRERELTLLYLQSSLSLSQRNKEDIII